MNDASTELDLRGSLDSVEPDGRAYGWCWSPDEPDTRRAIRILLDGEEAAAAIADVLRADLLAAGIGDGGHGFAADLSAARRHGTSAALLVDAATGRSIGGELAVAWREGPAALPPLVGNVDLITRDGWVSGWCWDPAEPARRLRLDVLVDDEVAGSVDAAEPRADLGQAGVGDGRYGFNLMLPYEALADRGEMRVRVVEQATGRKLGEAAVLRIGRRAASETRLQALERRVELMRSRLDAAAREAARQPEAEVLAARALFATVAGFFQDLADGRPVAGIGAGSGGSIAASLAELRRTLPVVALRSPVAGPDRRPLATLAVPATGPVEQVHACLAALRESDTDLVADIVLLDPSAQDPRCALLPALVANLRVGPAESGPAPAFARLLREADTRLVGLVAPGVLAGRGWLAGLADTLAGDPGAGLAGAVVIGADGLLHHGGFLLDEQLRLRELAPRADPNWPEHRVMRSVDAVAALAFLADRELVAAAGGLDPAYQDLSPAVADLCLALRARGHEVLRQSTATMIWTGPEAGPPEPLAATEDGRRLRLALLRHARDPRTGAGFVGHALVVDAELPVPDRDAGSVAALEQMLVLRRLGWRVTFAAAAASAAPAEADRRRLEAAGIEVAASGSITEWLGKAGADLRLVHLYRHRIATLLLPRVRELAPRARIVFSPADLHFLREAREAALAGVEAEDRVADIRAHEIACVREADATIVLSDHEHRLLSEELGPKRLHLLRWIVRPKAVVPAFEDREGLLFVGHFRHLPNVDAVLWYAREVLPILARLRPGLVLELVGADAPPAVLALQGEAIQVRGWTPDLAPLLARARLTIAPLRYGAGFKGKVATSLAAGVPVVGTPVAFEGTGLADGDGIASADNADALARAIAALHDDAQAWRIASARALERVAALYSPDAADAVFADLLSGLGLPVRTRLRPG